MSDLTEDERLPPPTGLNRLAVGAVVGGLSLLVAGALVALSLLLRQPESSDQVGQPMQIRLGRKVFLDRCVSCHGPKGKGDGPISKLLKGPPVGDLTDQTWKHGDRPEEVERLIGEGVPNTSMPGWGRTLGEKDLRCVTAYVYFLAGREVPQSIKLTWPNDHSQPD